MSVANRVRHAQRLMRHRFRRLRYTIDRVRRDAMRLRTAELRAVSGRERDQFAGNTVSVSRLRWDRVRCMREIVCDFGSITLYHE